MKESTVETVAPLAALALLLAASLCSCSTTYPVSASGPLTGRLTAQGASVQLLGFTVQDAGSIRAVATRGGIVYVQTVDVRSTNVLGIYRKSTTIVTGE